MWDWTNTSAPHGYNLEQLRTPNRRTFAQWIYTGSQGRGLPAPARPPTVRLSAAMEWAHELGVSPDSNRVAALLSGNLSGALGGYAADQWEDIVRDATWEALHDAWVQYYADYDAWYENCKQFNKPFVFKAVPEPWTRIVFKMLKYDNQKDYLPER